jgi:sulfur carrier protein ThiS
LENTDIKITVHVHLYGVLADYSGIKNIEIEVPEKTSISGFMKYASTTIPVIFKKEWMDPKESHSIVKVFRNGVLITPEMDRESVEEGDDIRFFSAISGG